MRSPTLLSSQPATISAAQQFARLGINTPLRAEKINPVAKLKSCRRTISPYEYEIKVATNELLDFVPPSDAELHASPDTPDSQVMYEMRLRYKFTVKTEKDNKAIPVRPSFPSLFNQLYDSPVDSQLWSLEDSQSQTLTFGGAVHHVQPVSLKKGDYSICLLLRHSEISVLEQMKDLPCELLLTLPDALPCDVYSELDMASTPSVKDDTGRSTVKAATLKRGSHKDVYVSRPTKDLPSWIEVGDVLVGSIVLNKDQESVTSLQLLYNVPPKSNVKDAKEDKANEKKKKDTLDDVLLLDYTAGLRKKNIAESSDEYEKNLTALIEERQSSVPLLLERLSFSLQRTVPSTESEEDDRWRATEVELVYNDMLKVIDTSVLAHYFGVNEPEKEDLEDDEEADELNKDMKEQRSALKKILLSRAFVSSKIVEKDTSSSAIDELNTAVKEMKKWVAKADNLDDVKDKARLSITLPDMQSARTRNRLLYLSC